MQTEVSKFNPICDDMAAACLSRRRAEIPEGRRVILERDWLQKKEEPDWSNCEEKETRA